MTEVQVHDPMAPIGPDGMARAVPSPGSAAAEALAEAAAEASLVGAIRSELDSETALVTAPAIALDGQATHEPTAARRRTPRFDAHTWSMVRSAGMGMAIAGTIALGYQHLG